LNSELTMNLVEILQDQQKARSENSRTDGYSVQFTLNFLLYKKLWNYSRSNAVGL